MGWTCNKCQQMNADWAPVCGRCDFKRSDSAFDEFIMEYGEKMFGNKWVFHDSSRPSGLSSHGDDMKAAFDRALALTN